MPEDENNIDAQTLYDDWKRPLKIAPSLLSADFSCLQEALDAVEEATDIIHLDVMDGHFVPNLTFGPPVIRALRSHSKMMFDVHLMIDSPERSLEAYVKAGADRLSVHVEATPHIHRTLMHIRELGVKAGLAINPGTSAHAVEPLLGAFDVLLVMTVNPGFGGQRFIEAMLEKISRLRALLDSRGYAAVPIMVDGGVDRETIGPAYRAGAQEFVAGTSVYGAGKGRPADNVRLLQEVLAEAKAKARTETHPGA
ncbi:MAG: ribulose-phosphate 3-epimerase [Candidatus Carbobacillus altaicus]|nr:ribulose-phosphate 3-epimerase [Candidatus Carbobacillus altaicus]